MVPTTNRSPITVMTVVDVVGVRPKGHTSFGAPVGRQIVASAASGLSGLDKLHLRYETACQLHQFEQFACLAGVGDEQHNIVLADDAEVAVLCFAGMQEVGGRAGRTEGGRDVHGDLSCFSHTAGDQIPSEFVYMFHNECHSLFIAVGYRNIAYCFSFLLQNG